MVHETTLRMTSDLSELSVHPRVVPLESIDCFRVPDGDSPDVRRKREEIVYELRAVKLVFAWAEQHRVTGAIRGSQLDKALLNNGHPELARAMGAASRPFTAVGFDDCVPVYCGSPPLAGTLDLKFHADDLQFLFMLRTLLRALPAPEAVATFIPPGAKDLYRRAWDLHKPMRYHRLAFTQALDGRALSGLMLERIQDQLHIPVGESIRVTTKTWPRFRARLRHPELVYQCRPRTEEVIYFILDSDPGDIRVPSRCSNLDGLSAAVTVVGHIDFSQNNLAKHLDELTVNITLPELPPVSRFDDRVLDDYEERIQNGDMTAMEEFVEVAARAVRKSATFHLPQEDHSSARVATIMELIAKVWQTNKFQQNLPRIRINSQELQTAVTLWSDSFNVIRRFHLHLLMHPFIREVFEREPHIGARFAAFRPHQRWDPIEEYLNDEIKINHPDTFQSRYHPYQRWLSLSLN